MSIRSERHPKSAVPPGLQLFETRDIEPFFRYLEKSFKLSPKWYQDYRTKLQERPRSESELDFFFTYVMKFIEPMMKQLLVRKDIVTHAICRYLIKDRIEEFSQRPTAGRNGYSNGNR